MGSSGEESDQEVLYHQLATEEIEEEVEEERRRIFRPRIHHNSIMKLSIHNRRLFFICLAVIEAFGISAVILTIHWAINIKGGVTYVENMGIPFQLAPHPHDHLPHLSLWQRSSHLQDHPTKERRAQASTEACSCWHHDCCLCTHGHRASGSF